MSDRDNAYDERIEKLNEKHERLRNAAEYLVDRLHMMNSDIGHCVCCGDDDEAENSCGLEALKVVIAKEDLGV